MNDSGTFVDRLVLTVFYLLATFSFFQLAYFAKKIFDTM
jgi:hypothetical protein